MSEWTMIRWHGAVETVAASLRQLGWRGPEEAPAEAADPRVGGFIPPPGEPIRLFDGIAYAALAANAPIETPAGLSVTGPDLSSALLGTF
jgi:hypothetical protein